MAQDETDEKARKTELRQKMFFCCCCFVFCLLFSFHHVSTSPASFVALSRSFVCVSLHFFSMYCLLSVLFLSVQLMLLRGLAFEIGADIVQWSLPPAHESSIYGMHGAITSTFHHVLYNMTVDGSNEMNKKISASLIHFPRLLFAILFVFIIIMRDEYFSVASFSISLSLSLALQPMFCISFDFNICVPSGGTELWSWADTTANNGGQRRRTPKKKKKDEN